MRMPQRSPVAVAGNSSPHTSAPCCRDWPQLSPVAVAGTASSARRCGWTTRISLNGAWSWRLRRLAHQAPNWGSPYGVPQRSLTEASGRPRDQVRTSRKAVGGFNGAQPWGRGDDHWRRRGCWPVGHASTEPGFGGSCGAVSTSTPRSGLNGARPCQPGRHRAAAGRSFARNNSSTDLEWWRCAEGSGIRHVRTSIRWCRPVGGGLARAISEPRRGSDRGRRVRGVARLLGRGLERCPAGRRRCGCGRVDGHHARCE